LTDDQTVEQINDQKNAAIEAINRTLANATPLGLSEDDIADLRIELRKLNRQR
jgi:hypothetical protein